MWVYKKQEGTGGGNPYLDMPKVEAPQVSSVSKRSTAFNPVVSQASRIVALSHPRHASVTTILRGQTTKLVYIPVCRMRNSV